VVIDYIYNEQSWYRRFWRRMS